MDEPTEPNGGSRDALYVLLPLLIVLSTLLFLLLLFLVCVLFLRRRRGIMLSDSDGPVDMSREELIDGEGGFEGVEERWLESVPEELQRAYRRAKDFQTQYPPNSLPTDITLSQFLSIQEKGVAAWCFEPDYETMPSLLVHARTEITFLPDPSTSSSVQSNLPLPKLNEVYYWEVKCFDLPQTTNIAVGLATKPYPSFRLPGHNRYSVAYHSNGDKSHNFPFTSQTFGPTLKEGDVLGVGYRPRTGTVFFTRNGRKMDDAFVGLTRWNLFPTVGADGPCSLHVNLGQSGFVFIEANVKKWGLAPSVGTLAPPPAYGSERGSILLEAGGGIRSTDGGQTPPGILVPTSSSVSSRRGHHRSRRPRPSSAPVQSSPLRSGGFSPPSSPPPPITPIEEENTAANAAGPSNGRYISPTDAPFHTPALTNLPASPSQGDAVTSDHSSGSSSSRSRSISPTNLTAAHSRNTSASGMTMRLHPPPESPMNPEPPTPNEVDIHLQAMSPMSSRAATPGVGPLPEVGLSGMNRQGDHAPAARPPPAYSPLDAFRYSEGVHVDLPAEVIAAALEGGSIPASAVGQSHNSSRPDRHRSRRDRRS
ncbi:SPRY-domain-containing protein [Rickenella mellea]|uniref:SPRY-domain-containing protein n=1 Tax=Rickenella mellea TaxID=50990 RepID=A0A4Y7QLP2_9AGAM|nr:SPRY-domain-containing protein [Rickenella mellea]